MAHPPTPEQRLAAVEALLSIQGNIINDLREQLTDLLAREDDPCPKKA